MANAEPIVPPMAANDKRVSSEILFLWVTANRLSYAVIIKDKIFKVKKQYNKVINDINFKFKAIILAKN
jgi:hypothetical protein